MAYPQFSTGTMVSKGSREGAWAGAASAVAVAIVSVARASGVAFWTEEHDAEAVAALLPVLIGAVKMVRNFIQEH